MSTNIENPRNPRWHDAAHTLVMLTIDLNGQAVNFLAHPADPHQHGRDLLAQAIAGEFGPIAAYAEPVASAEEVLELAQLSLRDSDSLLMQHFEDGLPPPAALVAYRKALRALIANPVAGASIPARPAI